jgi:hypothetical protein
MHEEDPDDRETPELETIVAEVRRRIDESAPPGTRP